MSDYSGTDHSVSRRFLLGGTAAAAILAVTALAFIFTTGSHTAATILVISALCVLLAVSGAGLAAGRKWAAVLACGTGIGFVVATLDITVFGYRSIPPVKFLAMVPALYMGSLPAIPSVRTRFGFKPLSPRALSILYGAACLTAILAVGGYFSLINSKVPSEITRLRSEPLTREALAAVDSREFSWHDNYNGLLPVSGIVVEESDLVMAVKTGDGEMVRVTREMSFWNFDYSFFGYTSIYEFEKAVWNAGYSQPALLLIKNGLAFKGIQVLHLDGPGTRALVHTRYDEVGRIWITAASIYLDGDLGSSYHSMSPVRARSLSPVMLTIQEAVERNNE
jgi:hypothetical protein